MLYTYENVAGIKRKRKSSVVGNRVLCQIDSQLNSMKFENVRDMVLVSTCACASLNMCAVSLIV